MYRPFWWISIWKKKSCIIDTSSTIGNGKSEGTTVSRSGEKCGQNDRRHQNKNFISQNNSNHRLSTSSLMLFPYSLTVKLFFFSFVVVFFFVFLSFNSFSFYLSLLHLLLVLVVRANITKLQLDHSIAFESLKHVIAIIISVPITSVIVMGVW